MWRHSPGTHNEGSTHKHAGVNKRLTPRAHSDVFLLTQIAAGGERGADDTIENEKIVRVLVGLHISTLNGLITVPQRFFDALDSTLV